MSASTIFAKIRKTMGKAIKRGTRPTYIGTPVAKIPVDSVNNITTALDGITTAG